jgi:hypothetical protein
MNKDTTTATSSSDQTASALKLSAQPISQQVMARQGSKEDEEMTTDAPATGDRIAPVSKLSPAQPISQKGVAGQGAIEDKQAATVAVKGNKTIPTLLEYKPTRRHRFSQMATEYRKRQKWYLEQKSHLLELNEQLARANAKAKTYFVAQDFFRMHLEKGQRRAKGGISRGFQKYVRLSVFRVRLRKKIRNIKASLVNDRMLIPELPMGRSEKLRGAVWNR